MSQDREINVYAAAEMRRAGVTWGEIGKRLAALAQRPVVFKAESVFAAVKRAAENGEVSWSPGYKLPAAKQGRWG